MAYDYDALYRTTPDALGAPTRAFCEFFETFSKPSARILDVGCGQGRDALFIARLGHLVTGVDLSSSGIACLLKQAAREGLSVEGDVADIASYDPCGMFDVIVFDRTLHMLERTPRMKVLARLTEKLAKDGFLLIADEPSNLPDFHDVLNITSGAWSIVREEKGLLFLRREPEAQWLAGQWPQISR